MGRIRTVKPKLFTHEGLFDAEHESGLPLRLAFIGLFTEADREGRFQWRPRSLKAAILPFDDVDFSRVLDALATRGFLVKYTSRSGELLGAIPTFRHHQAINNKETQSELDSPTEDDLAKCASLASQRLPLALSTRRPRVKDASPPTLRNTRGEGKGREGKGKEGKGTKPSLAETTTTKDRVRARGALSSSSASEGQIAIMAALRHGRARRIPDAERRLVEAAIAGATPAQIADCCATAVEQKPKGFTANYVLGIVLNRLAEGFYSEPVSAVCAEAMPRYADGRRDELDSIAKDRKRVSDALTGRTRRALTEADANVIDVPMPEVSDDSHRS